MAQRRSRRRSRTPARGGALVTAASLLAVVTPGTAGAAKAAEIDFNGVAITLFTPDTAIDPHDDPTTQRGDLRRGGDL
jgi:hypothetical protein